MCSLHSQGSLNLTLSVPICCATTTGSVSCHCNRSAKIESQQDLASQVAKDFASQLASNLTTGPLNVLLEDDLNRILANVDLHQKDHGAVRKATQTLAAKYASELVEKFPKRFAKSLSVVNNVDERTGPETVPQTTQEYQDFIADFIHTQQLTKMYDPNDSYIKEIAQKAADNVTAKLQLPPGLTSGLVKLSLYDFVILCDDSGSMTNGSRVAVLKNTLRRVAEFATILTPEGISVRFLNYDQDETGTCDNLTTVDKIEHIMRNITFTGGTPLGSVLNRKIVQPFILQKAESGKLRKPVIVVTITDGEPNPEPIGHRFQDAILRCKRSPALRSYGDATVIFIVSRVGDSPEAQDFIGSIKQENELERMVYCSLNDLDEQHAVFLRAKDNAGYTTWLIKLFLAALDVPRRKDEPRPQSIVKQ